MDTPKKKKQRPVRLRLYLLTALLTVGSLMALSVTIWHAGSRKSAETAMPLTVTGFNSPVAIETAMPLTVTGFISPVAISETDWYVQNGTEAQRAIVKLIDTDLPASATNFAYLEAYFIDESIWMRFDIAPDDMDWLQTARHLCPELRSGYSPFEGARTPHEAWWHPNTATVFAGNSCGEAYKSNAILVDMTQDTAWIVYLKISFRSREN